MARKTQRNPVDAQITQVKLRLPESTRLMLLAHAVRNSRSLNSEIVHRLEASLAAGSGTTMIARAIVRDLDPTLLDAIAKEHRVRAKGPETRAETPGLLAMDEILVRAAPAEDKSKIELQLRDLPRKIALLEERALNDEDPHVRDWCRRHIDTLKESLRRFEDGQLERAPAPPAVAEALSSTGLENDHKPVLRRLPRMIASYEKEARIEKDPCKREALRHVIGSIQNIEDGREPILRVLPRTIASYEERALTEKDPRKLEAILHAIEILKDIERDWKVQKAARRLQGAE